MSIVKNCGVFLLNRLFFFGGDSGKRNCDATLAIYLAFLIAMHSECFKSMCSNNLFEPLLNVQLKKNKRQKLKTTAAAAFLWFVSFAKYKTTNKNKHTFDYCKWICIFLLFKKKEEEKLEDTWNKPVLANKESKNYESIIKRSHWNREHRATALIKFQFIYSLYTLSPFMSRSVSSGIPFHWHPIQNRIYRY